MIGGNTEAQLQELTTQENAIGESIEAWATIETLIGYLDLIGETTNKTNYHSKIAESTDVFICDYVALDQDPENKSMLINGKRYDVKFIDNPMNLNQHLEIYLKYVGGQ